MPEAYHRARRMLGLFSGLLIAFLYAGVSITPADDGTITLEVPVFRRRHAFGLQCQQRIQPMPELEFPEYVVESSGLRDSHRMAMIETKLK